MSINLNFLSHIRRRCLFKHNSFQLNIFSKISLLCVVGIIPSKIFCLFQATGDPYYLEVGKNIVEKINEHARVPCGFAALRDVRTLSHEDRYIRS